MCLLELKSLSKDYGGKKGLFDFSMKLNKGDIVGLIGVNGAGKTTLLNTVAGNIIPDSGEILYQGNIVSLDSKYRGDFGISVNPGFYDYLNTYENLKSICFLNGKRNDFKSEIKEVLKIVGLKDVENKKIKEFSFGMKQRLGFAQAILNANSIMFLDEPFVGLDINGRSMVKDYIKELVEKKQMAVIFSDHNLDEVKSLCNRLIVIREGKKIYDGDIDMTSSIVLKVESTKNINLDYANILDDETIITTEDKIQDKINHISSVTSITKIEKIINPLEKMMEGK